MKIQINLKYSKNVTKLVLASVL